MTIYKGDVTVTVLNNGEKHPSKTFENEHLDFTSIDGLWIKNLSNDESELIESLKLWHEMDNKTNLTSFYIFETKNPAFVRKSFKHVIKTINEQGNTISLDWVKE